MKKWIFILSGLLAAQLVLAVVLNLTGEDYGTIQAEEKLVSFNRQAVDGLRIEDGTDSVVLKKQAGKWLLPESGDFPASQPNVERLLDKLAALEKGWPVAKTRSAARRFAVDEEQFERKLTLFADDDAQATLYVGSSPGIRKVYVRPGEADEVFAVDFNTWEANAQDDDWIDKGVLTLDESVVGRLELPGIIMQRQDGRLQVMNLEENEQTNVEESSALLGKLTGLRVQSLLGTESEPEYRQDEPVLEVRITTEGGGVLDYRFSKPQDATYYVLKRSDLDFFFEVAEHTVNPVREATREKLVQARTEEAPKDGDASRDGKKESDTGGESAKEDK
jgi:Domain of unknown function (DUF4340)